VPDFGRLSRIAPFELKNLEHHQRPLRAFQARGAVHGNGNSPSWLSTIKILRR
jgi:hypothetical protein